jgi:hypothetical protein
MDTYTINGYLIIAHRNEDITHRGYYNYQETLATELLMTTDDGPEQVVEPRVVSPQSVPGWITLTRRSYCKWCTEHKEQTEPRAKRRKILGELPNRANLPYRAFVP